MLLPTALQWTFFDHTKHPCRQRIETSGDRVNDSGNDPTVSMSQKLMVFCFASIQIAAWLEAFNESSTFNTIHCRGYSESLATPRQLEKPEIRPNPTKLLLTNPDVSRDVTNSLAILSAVFWMSRTALYLHIYHPLQQTQRLVMFSVTKVR